MLLLGSDVDAQATNPGDGALTVDGNDITVTTTGGQFTANKADATTLALLSMTCLSATLGIIWDGALTYTPGNILMVLLGRLVITTSLTVLVDLMSQNLLQDLLRT